MPDHHHQPDEAAPFRRRTPRPPHYNGRSTKAFRKPKPRLDPSNRSGMPNIPPCPAHAVQVAVHHAGRDPVAGLGIGANSAIFSLFDQMLLRPLPVPQPEELVNLAAPGPSRARIRAARRASCDEVFSYPMFRDLERVQTSFTGIAAHRNFGASLGLQGHDAERRRPARVGQLLSGARPQPALGRLLTPDDDKTVGGHFVVVLSHDYWRTRFALNPNVLNQTLVVNGQAMTIVGVAPRGFNGTTLGDEPGRLRADHDARADVARLQRLREPPPVLGVSVRAPEARRLDRAGDRRDQRSVSRIINDVEAPLQKGMSEQTMARFKAKQITLEPGTAARAAFDDEARTPLLICCWRDRHRAADRVRQHRQPAAGARRRPRRRDGGAPVDRRQPPPVDHAAADRIDPARGLRRGRRPARREVDARSDRVDHAGGRRPLIAFSLSPTMLLFAARSAVGTGLLFGLFPALHSTRPDLAVDAQEPGGPARRREGGARASAPRSPRCRSRCRWRCSCRPACSRRACSTSAASISASRPITWCRSAWRRS